MCKGNGSNRNGPRVQKKEGGKAFLKLASKRKGDRYGRRGRKRVLC